MRRSTQYPPLISASARGTVPEDPGTGENHAFPLSRITPMDTPPLRRRQIGPFTVTAIGLGCMNLNHAYGTPPAPGEAERLLLTALDLGVDYFDTAALYGFGANETLIGRVLSPHRSRLVLATKGGMAGVLGKRVIDGRPEAIRGNCEDSLRRLRTETIDLYYLHRWDRRVPIEESVGASVHRERRTVQRRCAGRYRYRRVLTRSPRRTVITEDERLLAVVFRLGLLHDAGHQVMMRREAADRIGVRSITGEQEGLAAAPAEVL